MSNVAKAILQLRRERDQIQKEVEQLDRALAVLGRVDGSGTGRNVQRFGRRTRVMSAAARRRIAVAQRARWAKWKAARRKK